jgi:hypothetical protein
VVPWVGPWRIAVFKVVYAVLRGDVSSASFAVSCGVFRPALHFIAAMPFLHLFTRRIYVGLQVASVGLGVLPVFICLAPLG